MVLTCKNVKRVCHGRWFISTCNEKPLDAHQTGRRTSSGPRALPHLRAHRAKKRKQRSAILVGRLQVVRGQRSPLLPTHRAKLNWRTLPPSSLDSTRPPSLSPSLSIREPTGPLFPPSLSSFVYLSQDYSSCFYGRRASFNPIGFTLSSPFSSLLFFLASFLRNGVRVYPTSGKTLCTVRCVTKLPAALPGPPRIPPLPIHRHYSNETQHRVLSTTLFSL